MMRLRSVCKHPHKTAAEDLWYDSIYRGKVYRRTNWEQRDRKSVMERGWGATMGVFGRGSCTWPTNDVVSSLNVRFANMRERFLAEHVRTGVFFVSYGVVTVPVFPVGSRQGGSVCVLALGEGPKAGRSRTQGRGRGQSRRSKVTPTAHNHPHRTGFLPGPPYLSLSLSLSVSPSIWLPLFIHHFISPFVSSVFFMRPHLFFQSLFVCIILFLCLLHRFISPSRSPSLSLSLEVQMDTFAG